MTIIHDIQTLEPGAMVELFKLDATAFGGDVVRFHKHTQIGSIWWQGNEYTPWPIMSEGFEMTADKPATPKLTVANVDGSITALCMEFEDLIGAIVTRYRTLGKYLDAANFPEGVNPDADPNEQLPPEIWYISRKAHEDNRTVQFELASGMDLEGIKLPRRQIIANYCSAMSIGGYRGPYCGYNGPPVATEDDTPTTDPALDKCSGRLSGCKLRQWPDGVLNFNGFPAASLTRF